jgi:hypothetical protein
VPAREYSRAFDNIVQDENDVVGLLAYALYKRAIREEAEAGNRSDGDGRNPSRTVVETYRAAAERKIEEVVQQTFDAAQPELQMSAAIDAVETARSNIVEHVTNRTAWLPAVITNVLAWAFTLFITLLAFMAFDRPSPVEVIADEATQTVIGRSESK